MTKYCLALAAGALLTASPALAQSPVTTFPTTSGTVVVSPQAFGTTAYSSQAFSSSPTAVTADEPARRGLFARIRARREARATPAAPAYGPVYGTPVFTASQYAAPTATPGTIITPAPATAPTPSIPMPMPMTMPGRMSMTVPAGMQTITVNGMTYTVPANLPPEGFVISERIITPTTGEIDRNVVLPVSGTVVTPGTVTPATFTIPLPRPMPMPR